MARMLAAVFLLCAGSLYRNVHAQAVSTRAQPLTVGVTDTIFSVSLQKDRALNIYLPPGYQDSDTSRYPVIYLLDGGMEEDFIHIAGLSQYAAFPWVHYIRPSIVVGIVNVDRKHDFTTLPETEADRKVIPTSGGATAFINFLKTELQPYISRYYRTSGQRTLIGESLGGLMASNILIHQPDLFDRYIIVSPSLWWNDGALLRGKMAPTQGRQITVFISVGKEGVTPGARPRIMEKDAAQFADQLKSAGIPGLRVFYNYMPGYNHATTGHQAILDAFRTMAEK